MKTHDRQLENNFVKADRYDEKDGDREREKRGIIAKTSRFINL